MLGPCISQNGRKSVTKLEWEKNEKKEIQLIREPSQVLAFLPDPFAFIPAFVLPPNPYKEAEDQAEDEDEQKEKGRRKERRTIVNSE